MLRDRALADHDHLEHGAGSQKRAQANYYDSNEFEAFETHRPHGSPALYEFLVAEKFRRAIYPIRQQLPGASVLAVCGGSGMDAEYFARAGCRVVSADISLGAALRAKNRFARYGIAALSIVADIERLPMADQAIDVVSVHDGLHHLTDPYAGLSEMARVARRWVIVSEPARASITGFAVRLGLALESEEAGNVVARLEPRVATRHLEGSGFTPVMIARYAMYYRHRPGSLSKILSSRPVFPIVRVWWRILDKAIGRFGNKMVVVAERVTVRSDSDTRGALG